MNVYIELCNFKNYPLGGHLSFAKHLTNAMQGELDLIGVTTDPSVPILKWIKKEIEGYTYSLFNVYYTTISSKRPLIPTRLTDYFALRKCINKINLDKYKNIIVQTPEVLFAIPEKYLPKVVLIMPGVENPLSISRYKIARNFQKIYDKIFFERARKTKCILAAADKKSISSCIIRSKGRISENKIHQFPTRYDSSIFNIKDKKTLRDKYGYSDNQTIIVTTGRLNWFKGWKFMIDSFNLFVRNNMNSLFFFIGDGEDKEKIEQYIKEVGLSNEVKLLGYQSLNVISDYLNMADLFIMGSYKEGWSTSLVEAVACGVPCVVTDFSSASEMVNDGINGFVIKERNEKVFADKINEAIKLPSNVIKEYSQEIKSLAVENMKTEFMKFLN